MSRIISVKTYIKYAKKYKLPYKKKKMAQLQKSIYNYEMKNSKSLFRKKADRKGNYGLYLIK